MFPFKSNRDHLVDVTVTSAEYLALPCNDCEYDDETEWALILNEIRSAVTPTIVLDVMDGEVLPPLRVQDLADALVDSNVRNVVVIGDKPTFIRALLSLELGIRAEIKTRLSR